MSTKATNDQNFENDISSNELPVVVDFGAEWCGPCKVLDPILEEIAEENKDKVKIYKMNIDENPMTPQKYGIRGIPTIMIFKKGELIDTKVGSLPKTDLENWIQSLDGVKEKLETGATVADIGCGLGSSSILMAKTFPNSKIYGYDFHEPSIIKAREKAEIEGVTNIEFAVSDAKNIPEKGYDFACIFDALHDMGDPVGVSKAILNTLNDDGTFMLVEPFANDELKDNLNSQSGLYYSFSTLICVPTSRAQEVGLQLGAQAGEKRLRSVLNEAGFVNIERRCLDIESNIVLEAKA